MSNQEEQKWVLVDVGTNRVKGFVIGDISTVPVPPIQKYLPLPKGADFPKFPEGHKPDFYKYENEDFVYVEEYEQENYRRNFRRIRQAAYPQIGEQLDAIWKGGEAYQEMLSKIQAVKDKYPKPE